MIRIGSIEDQHQTTAGRGEGEALFVVRPRGAMDDWLGQ
jgi:hypothetical protein